MDEIKKDVDISNFTTLKIGGRVKFFAEVGDKNDLRQKYNELREKGLPIFVIGGGSNTVFADGDLDCSVLKVNISGFEVIDENEKNVILKLGAGEDWDSVVERAVDNNWWGIEAMSAIPGTVGGTPVQNVGAYGSEIKDTLVKVEVFDRESMEFKILTSDECDLKYRDSIFKREAKNKYIITEVYLQLSKKGGKIPDYPGVKKYFDEKGIKEPTIGEIRKAIIEIRKNKLPDPSTVFNAGSFFKNPIVQNDIAQSLKNKYPSMPNFPTEDGKIKIPAGWLIEMAGLKGSDFGEIKTYENNALVLVNKGNAKCNDLMNAKDFIIGKVNDIFGITLEPEPIIVK